MSSLLECLIARIISDFQILITMSSGPPHPGAAWQECEDSTTGYPYYWNTVTNEVRWECPPDNDDNEDVIIMMIMR